MIYFDKTIIIKNKIWFYMENFLQWQTRVILCVKDMLYNFIKSENQFINNTCFWVYLMTCKGTCIRYHIKSNSGNRHYELGHKPCTTWEIFIKWDGAQCPCCNLILRTKPKNASARYQLLLVQQSRKNKWLEYINLDNSFPLTHLMHNQYSGIIK